MNKPLPVPPKQYDLAQSFDAMTLTGRKTAEKPLPDPPRRDRSKFISPELLAANAVPDNHRRPSQWPPQRSHHARPAPEAAKPPSVPFQKQIPMPAPQPRKQSLTLEYALESLRLDTDTPAMKPTLSPPFIPIPTRPRSDPIVLPKVAQPHQCAVTGPSQPPPNATPHKTQSVSAPPSSTTSSPGKGTVQCSGMTKAGKQCSRQVKLPDTHSRLDPTPVLYCHQHKETMITAQTGFYARKAGDADRFVEFSQYIPTYLQVDTQLALRVEMEKATSHADVPGYIYTFEIRDPKRPDVIQLKVGRAVNLVKRLDQWDKQCGSKVQIPRGWWPGTENSEDDGGTSGSLLKGNIKAGEPGLFCHRVERLVHIELTDLSLHAPYLHPGWPESVPEPALSARGTPKKNIHKVMTCLDCGAAHREIFAFPRPGVGPYQGKEWDLIVKPVIEKWGRFVKEYYA